MEEVTCRACSHREGRGQRVNFGAAEQCLRCLWPTSQSALKRYIHVCKAGDVISTDVKYIFNVIKHNSNSSAGYYSMYKVDITLQGQIQCIHFHSYSYDNAHYVCMTGVT